MFFRQTITISIQPHEIKKPTITPKNSPLTCRAWLKQSLTKAHNTSTQFPYSKHWNQLLTQDNLQRKISHTLISYLRIHLTSHYLLSSGGSKYIPRTCSLRCYSIDISSCQEWTCLPASQPLKIERYCNLLVVSYFLGQHSVFRVYWV